MALRIPGKGNFKPKRPAKPPVRRPPAGAPPTAAGATSSSSQPTPVRPQQQGPQPTAPETAPPATAPAAASAVAAPGLAAPAVAASPAPKKAAAAPPPPVAAPTVAPSPLPPTPTAAPPTQAPPTAVPIVAPSPQTSPLASTSRLPPAPTPNRVPSRGASSGLGGRSTPVKPLLTAAASNSSPIHKHVDSRGREKADPKPKAPPAPTAATVPAPPTPTQQSTVYEFSPTQPLRRLPETQPQTQPESSWGAPPVVAASSSPVLPVRTLDPPVDTFMPPMVVSVADDAPPTVASSSSTSAAAGPSSRPAASAPAAGPSLASLVAPPKKRKARATPAASTSTAAPKRARQARVTRRTTTVDSDDDEDDQVDALASNDDDSEGSVAPKRGRRGKYKSRGTAGTSKDRRTKAYRRSTAVGHPELDGVVVNQLVGAEVVPEVMTMSDLATTLVSQGRVSARTLKLHEFQKNEDVRKSRLRVEKTERNWRRRQIVRRKARQLRNERRAERREAARDEGEDAAPVSEDELDSDQDYAIEPDRLTPPGSPRKAERVAPIRFLPEAEGEGGEGGEGAAAEGEAGEGGDPAAAAAAPRGPAAADEEDIEGLGLIGNGNPYEDEEEEGEAIEGFQLPVEEGGDDFEGLAYGNYEGGHLDEEGNWVETQVNHAAALHRRNEDYRRRILEGDHDQPVELIDNDTQFVNSSTWGKKVANDRWTVEETELFFDVLRETGENYTLMTAYFPGRNVRQLKKKGTRENKNNPQRMTDAILNRKPLDKDYLVKSSGFNKDAPYTRETEFFEEVARDKERVRLGLDMEVDGDGEDGEQLDPMEFGDGGEDGLQEMEDDD